MYYQGLLALAIFLAFPTLKNVFQNDEKMGHDKINSQEIVHATVMEQNENLKDQTENLKPQQNLCFKPALTALSLDTVFFLLLIHACGDDLVGTIYKVFGRMNTVDGLVDLAFSFILAVSIMYKWQQRTEAEFVKTNTQLLKESLNKERKKKVDMQM